MVTLLRMRECGVALLGLSAWRTRGGHLGAQRPCGLVMLKKNRDSRRGDGQRWVGEGQWVKYTWKRLAKSVPAPDFDPDLTARRVRWVDAPPRANRLNMHLQSFTPEHCHLCK